MGAQLLTFYKGFLAESLCYGVLYNTTDSMWSDTHNCSESVPPLQLWDWYAERIINTLLCSLYRSVGGLNGMLPTRTHVA